MKNLILYFLIFLFSCKEATIDSKKEISNLEIKVELKRAQKELVNPNTDSNHISNNFTGDSSICQFFTKNIKIQVYDTLKQSNRFNFRYRIKSKISINVSFQDCEKNDTIYRCWTLKTSKKDIIKFYSNIEDGSETLISFNGRIFTLKKVYSEMFNKDSEINLDYDNGTLYQLKNGNLLYVEQPSRWCGVANQFDFYQYLDINKGEAILFSDEDKLVDSLIE